MKTSSSLQPGNQVAFAHPLLIFLCRLISTIKRKHSTYSYMVHVEDQRRTSRERKVREAGSGDAVFSTEHLYFPSSFLLISLSIKSLLQVNAINLDL